MCILLPNGIRVFPKRDANGHILHADYIAALGQIPVDDLDPIIPKAKDGCIFKDTEPDKPLSPMAQAIRENLRDVLTTAQSHGMLDKKK